MGLHGTSFFPPIVVGGEEGANSSDEVFFLPIPALTARIGVLNRVELGVSASAVGFYSSLMYALYPYRSPYQLSLIGGVGAVSSSSSDNGNGDDSSDFFSYHAGVLFGYYGEPEMALYGGVRFYWFEDQQDDGLGTLRSTNYIIGIEIDPWDYLSFPLELNIASSRSLQRTLGLTDENSVSYILFPTVNFGVTYTF